MWQQSHGCWPSLMKREVCLTNYPGGQTTCFSNATFLCLLSLSGSGYFSPRLLGTRAEPWHVELIFAFELALWINMYWLPAITFLFFLHSPFVKRVFFFTPAKESFLILSIFFRFVSLLGVQVQGWFNCSSPWPRARKKVSNAQTIVWHEIHNLQSGSNNS